MHLAKPWPLGATWDGKGIHFALFSKHASAVTLCLFDQSHRLIGQVGLAQRQDSVWFTYLPVIQNALYQPGLLYAYCVDGPWLPDASHRFDVSKLLLDPYARQIEQNPSTIDGSQTAYPSASLKACVVVDNFDWGNDSPLNIPFADTVLYELHIKGFSQNNEAIAPELRGTYLGLAHDASIAHLKTLGVTTVSVLPVHYWLDEPRLTAQGLINYWGYNSIGFFAPTPRLASTASTLSVRDQFRQMVKTLHANGFEVILDVVYNHTAESDEHGPTISFRGIDNSSYYWLTEGSALGQPQARVYENFSGCGNVLDIRQPAVLKLVMDSLRYWVSDMHVDGFRFDLAPILGRTTNGFNTANAFLMAIAQDPILATVKLIAEPWDIGPNGYQLGNFPSGWSEWNDKFRDTVRGYWLGQALNVTKTSGNPAGAEASNRFKVTRGEFAKRLCASADVFASAGRMPFSSVNFVTAHDGFTLRDLVSYKERHNQANGEENRDGHGHNQSDNCGHEGASFDVAVNQRRALLQRALLATTLLAQGTPMLCAGDEIGKTQNGNNNAYCQDNDTSWLDWSGADQMLVQFVAKVLKIRKDLGALASGQWFDQTLQWYEPDGSEIPVGAWDRLDQPAFYCAVRKTFVMGFNPTANHLEFCAPAGLWQIALDSSNDLNASRTATAYTTTSNQAKFIVPAHSVVVLKTIP